MFNENFKLNPQQVDLQNIDGKKCKEYACECGCVKFIPCSIFKVVPPEMAKDGKEHISMPILFHICLKCGKHKEDISHYLYDESTKG